jgi:hypothetical protein
LTNSENSDGRWPPPPSQTCPFNVKWCEDEIGKTAKVLDALERSITTRSAPKCRPSKTMAASTRS